MMKALIDGDILVYECAFGSEDRETGEVYSFDSLRERLDKKIFDICEATKSDSYQIYLTGNGNFRDGIAVTKPYKGNRKQEKPFHYENIRVYLQSLGAIVVDGMEADDAISIEQFRDWIMLRGSKDSEEHHSKVCYTIICTRDKDLRQVPGWHYGWELGNQPEYHMKWVDELGELELVEKNKSKELHGNGLKFFYSQLITGDTTDNIPGLKGGGGVLAFNLLNECQTEKEMFLAVREAYINRAIKDNPQLGEALDSYVDALLLEQGRLLWMVRELNQDGSPVMWELPKL